MKKMVFVCMWLQVASLFCEPGISYRLLQLPNTSYMNAVTNYQSIHVIEIDPHLYEIKLGKALDNGLGRESVLSLNKRHGALASINGGFFSIGGTYDGRACGTLKIHDWVALPTKPRGCIGWSSQTQMPVMDRLLVTVSGETNALKFPINGLNKARNEGELILFNSAFNRTTLTDPDGEEVTVIDGIVTSIREGGSSKIPGEGYVLSIHNTHPLFHTLQIGIQLQFHIDIQPLLGLTTAEEWEACDYILNGVPLLIYDHKPIEDVQGEQIGIPTFLTNRHARTAIGILPSGNWLLVVVDHTTLFDGMTIPELTQLMKELGCLHALNLDGGGSSTMVYEGHLKNSPRGDEDERLGDAKVRRVSEALMVLSKNIRNDH